jgi:hypothetical protein
MAADYTDHFTIATDAPGTPEQWARAMFGDTPSAAEVFIWRVMLGLRLTHGRSPNTVAGWLITAREPDHIRLAATGPLLSATLTVLVSTGDVALTTTVTYNHPAARLLWTPLSAVHRALVPRVLRTANATMKRRSARHEKS